MKLRHIALIGSLFPFLLAIVLFFGVLISAEDDDGGGGSSSWVTGMNLSAEVLKHQPMVEKYAKEYGISKYVPYLLAIIQVESGGTAEDVMQSSESMGLPPNSLDTESSIKQGCKYFASLLSSAESQGIEDINVVVQSYNYGGGYIGYVAKNGKSTASRWQRISPVTSLAGRKSPTRTLSLSPAMVAGDMPTEICSMWSLSASILRSVKYRASWHRR